MLELVIHNGPAINAETHFALLRSRHLQSSAFRRMSIGVCPRLEPFPEATRRLRSNCPVLYILLRKSDIFSRAVWLPLSWLVPPTSPLLCFRCYAQLRWLSVQYWTRSKIFGGVGGDAREGSEV